MFRHVNVGLAMVVSVALLGCPPEQMGLLQVNITPQAAIEAGAGWFVNGGQTGAIGAQISVPAYTYTISFTDVPGWIKPASRQVTVGGNGQLTVVTAAYQQDVPKGAVSVSISPAAIAGSAYWKLDGGVNQMAGTTVSQIAAGVHSVTFTEVPGYVTPAAKSITVVAGKTESVSATYAVQVLNTSHYGRFTTYEGSKTCRTCHPGETQDAHASLHYQWKGASPDVEGQAEGGKLGAINDFCTYADISWISQLTNLKGAKVDGGCAQCHVGMGDKPVAQQTTDQLNNIDCLLCHSEKYKRKVATVNSKLRFVPAPEKMSVSLLAAITDIKLPGVNECLNCHANAGGGNNNKRGDLEEAHRAITDRAFDVHMAPQSVGGAGLVCIDCHVTQRHRIAGRGIDLRATDLDVAVACSNCHGTAPHGNSNLDKHTKRLNCTVCHIPRFAKGNSTDMIRDYSMPAEVDAVKQLYEPHITRQANVVPEYKFFNGMSRIHEFFTPITLNARGYVTMAEPLGAVTDAGAKIQALKHHRAVQAYDVDTQYLLPVKAGILFQTGDVDKAFRQGAAEVGITLAHGYDFVDTERFMGIFHEVAPKEQALKCADCHSGGKRLDFKALGYTPKTTRGGRPLCASCHEDESGEWSASVLFTKVHDKHVKDKRIDCIQCHVFPK